MIKVVVIFESVLAGVIRRVDVDKLDFVLESRFEGVEGDEIVAFEEEIGVGLGEVIFEGF